MTEIQQNRYDQLLRRVGGLIGPGAKVADVLTELFPMFDVENMPAELLLLSGTRLCIGGGVVTGVSAESTTAQLFNPADSGILATITSVIIAAQTTGIVRWGVVPVVRGVAVGTETFSDTRLGVVAQPVCDIREDSAVALADGTMQTRVLANTSLTIANQNAVAVLGPGTGFEIGLTTNNQDLNFAFQWRERVAERAELNL